jgi:alkylresorcinol/alkylpyrone synthase
VLVIAVELPSLTFQRRDVSQANLISTILFGDGAAAAVVTGRPVRGPKILEVASYLLPDTLDAMGFDLQGDGFHIVLSKEVPQLIRNRIKSILCATLVRRGLSIGDVAAFVMHPGGRALLQAIQDELGLTEADTQPSWNVLRECGNQSSASVLFVLDEWLRTRELPSGAYGMLAAFGPGFSAETALLQWD